MSLHLVPSLPSEADIDAAIKLIRIENALDRLYADTVTQYVKGRDVSDYDAMAEALITAAALDAAHPHGPRLMDEIRGLQYPAAA